MLLFHSTPGHNSYSIFTQGIKIDMARNTPHKIYLHTWRKRKWARLHLAVRYHCDPRQITSFAVDVPRLWLKKHSRGLWTCECSIFSNRMIGQTFYVSPEELNDSTMFGYDFDIFSRPGDVPWTPGNLTGKPPTA